MIKASGLTKRYKKQVAVDDLSFTVKPGRVTGFLGPNGAGKSTTMRVMLGLDNGEGSTVFDGKRLSEYEQPSKVVGILLEAKAFHPTRTALHHLQALAAAGDVPESRAKEVLDMVGLSEVAAKKPGKFSLGMSQRLGIAAALLGNPKYLLLDEPANGLDPEGIAWLRKFLKEYAAEGNGVFVSSHQLSEMAQIAEDIVVIGKGKLIANTSVEKLVSGSDHSSVFVRVDKRAVLERELKAGSITFSREGKGLKTTGVTTDQIGKLAFRTGVTLFELAPHNASLEEAFLALTKESEEFRMQEDTSTKRSRQ